jgi:hypothetical protein
LKNPSRIGLWGVCAALIVTIAIVLTLLNVPGRSRAVQLQAYAIGPGQIRVEWERDRKSAGDRTAGTLEIRDGDAVTKLPLDAVQVQSGAVTYVGHSSHISVHLGLSGGSAGDGKDGADVEVVGVPPPLPTVAENTSNEAAREEEPKVSFTPQPKAIPDPRPPVQLPPKRTPFAIRPRPAQRPVMSAAGLPVPPPVDPAAPVVRLPSDFVSVPALSANPPVPAAVAKIPAYTGPRSGRIIWTGVLRRHDVIEIDGSRASNGSVVGGLPGVPVSLSVLPAEFTRDGLIAYTANQAKAEVTEAPAKSNGWNALRFRVDSPRARQLVILEDPNRSNDFKRVVVRNEGKNYSVIVMDWNVE